MNTSCFSVLMSLTSRTSGSEWTTCTLSATIRAGVPTVASFAFNRGKSFLANGMFIGCTVGCLYALSSKDNTYSHKMSYIVGGMLCGLLLGILTRMVFPFFKKAIHKKPEAATPSVKSVRSGDSRGPGFWVSSLAISGVSAGLALAVLFTMTYQQAMLWIAGLVGMGCVVGSVAGPFRKKMPWIGIILELWTVLALSIGIGAIVGWKFVLPILLFDVNPPVSTEVLARVANSACAAAGGLTGVIAWTVTTFRRKRESRRGSMESLT